MKTLTGLCCALFVVGSLSVAPAASDDPAVMQTRRATADFNLSTDPDSSAWRGVSGVIAATDPYGRPLPGARTEIRSRWTANNLYFLFISEYQSLYPRPNPTPEKEAWGLWDYDVVEVFIGHDLENINRYKEFEISPDGEFIDLDVDRQRKGKEVDWLWNSGLRYKTRIDRDRKVWICEMQIPWKSIDTRAPKADNELRLNLYRIEGGPKDRKYIVWRPIDNRSYHTPEKFGRLRLVN
jgi:hypothetical protein